MRARKQTGPRHVDGGSVLRCLAEWAAQFHHDSSPARVTDVLVASPVSTIIALPRSPRTEPMLRLG
jgi:hypothetical protein